MNFKFGFILLRYIVIHCCFFLYELLFSRLKIKASYDLIFLWGFIQFSSIAWKIKFIFLTFHWTLEKYWLIFFFTKLLIINVFQCLSKRSCFNQHIAIIHYTFGLLSWPMDHIWSTITACSFIKGQILTSTLLLCIYVYFLFNLLTLVRCKFI